MKRFFFTDGSCRGNPGPGGFGIVELCACEDPLNYEEDAPFQLGCCSAEQFIETTNNRMEMLAILKVFQYAEWHPKDDFVIYTDSAYCANIINCWIQTWAKNNWKNSKNKDVENKDLVLELWKYIQCPKFNVSVVHIKGHNGILGNELADKLATNDKQGFLNLIMKHDIKVKGE